MSRRNGMEQIKSLRAKKLFENPKAFREEKSPLMRHYPGGLDLDVLFEADQIVKNLSFHGKVSPLEMVLLESMANLLIGRPISFLDTLTLRESEAFLRDKNSEPALEGMSEKHETEFKKILQWLKAWPRQGTPVEYSFPSEKGPFRNLKLVEKIREIKAFLNSPEILTLYQGLPRPELVDVEELTVYIQAPYDSQREKAVFEELHHLGVTVFREEDLNFIPEP
jgi:hypothetical protein